MENRTARLTLLIDPKKKDAFERLCDLEDVTPSQLVRQFIRDYLESRLGPDWQAIVFNSDNANNITANMLIKKTEQRTAVDQT